MPTYDYVCDKCLSVFEAYQKITDEPLIICYKCQENTLKRKYSIGSAIKFTGTGFYETDYKGK